MVILIGMSNLDQIVKIAERLQQLDSENQLRKWFPIDKQKAFLDCKAHRKALCAANQVGKSATLKAEITYHITGLYPSWWNGIRFDHPITCWVCGESWERVRDTLQADLFGEDGNYGTGYIPRSCLDLENGIIKKSQIPQLIHRAKIKHVSGGWSKIQFFSYSQERKEFQGSTIEIVCFDEEPPLDIHNECMIRIAVKNGYALYAFTPLQNYTEVIDGLVTDPHAKMFSISMDDVPWLTKERIDIMLKPYSERERNARRHGMWGTSGGRIFSFDKDEYLCQSFEIPAYWPRLGGLDVGRSHPFAAVAIAWDRDSDCVYVYQEFVKKDSSAAAIAMELKHWGIKFATSHDAFNESFGHGEDTTAKLLEKEGLKVFNAGRQPWMRIEKIRSLIAAGRLWIFEDKCPELAKQMLTYHTKEDPKGGRTDIIYKVNDDVMDAASHAIAFYEQAEIKGFKKRNTVHIDSWKPADSKIGY
jgi:phage terminase large subunit-like protein